MKEKSIEDMRKAATVAYKRLATLTSNKPYNNVMSWLRCHLSFSLLRSAILCLRGSRSKRRHHIHSGTPIDVILHEGHTCIPMS